MQNRKPDRTQTHRSRDAGPPADFLAGEKKRCARRQRVRTIELKSEHPFFQTAPRGRPLYRFLPEVASLVERDRAIEARFQCNRLVGGIYINARDAIFDADCFELCGIDAARAGRSLDDRGDRGISRIAWSDHGYRRPAVTRQVADERAAS